MEHKVCTIVGMGQGVSMAVAKRFGKEGFAIAMISRRQSALDRYADQLRSVGIAALGFAADIADPAELKIALDSIHKTLGETEVLVYNAAVMRQAVPSELSPAQLNEDVRVNITGALIAAQHVLPAMKKHKRGTILFTGGGLALEPYPMYTSLAIGKAGIRSLAYSLYGELQTQGIHVATVTICGFVQPSTKFDPDRIAEEYWRLHTQPKGKWEREVVYK
jgi:short-subunit dehydrogenase